MKQVTRRNFLGLSAAAVSGMALASVAGCSPSAEGDSGIQNSAVGAGTASDASTAYAVRASGADRFAIKPVKASELGEPYATCEWLVIGGGNTGLFAAIHGLELGMDTILLEKNPMTGGAGVGTEATQLFNDSKYLQESGSPCGTSAEVYHYFQMQNAWLSDGLLVSNYIKHNHGPHDWLYDNGMGIVFCASGGVEAPVGGIMYEGMGSGVNAFVTEKFEEKGGRLYTSMGATKLVVDDSGAVVGALADGKDEKDLSWERADSEPTPIWLLTISAKRERSHTSAMSRWASLTMETVSLWLWALAVSSRKRCGLPHLGRGRRQAPTTFGILR